MIYIKLFYHFLIVGLFSIGGYTVIPIVKDVAKYFDGLTDEMISNFIAIAESTPGPVAVNLATFIGAEEAGILGAIVATIAVILPAFLIILFFAIFATKLLKYDKVKKTLAFIRPCVIGIVMAVGCYMFYENFDFTNNEMMIKTMFVALILILVMFLYKKVKKQKMAVIPTIIVGAILGIVINAVM